MRRNPNKPIEPINLKNEIATPRFIGKDPRLGRADRSGRRGASYGSMVGLENTAALLKAKMWDTVLGSVQSVAGAKYKKDQKDKEDLLTINQIQNTLQKELDEKDKKYDELFRQSTLGAMGELGQVLLSRGLFEDHKEAVDAIHKAHLQGDIEEYNRRILELGELMGVEESYEPSDEQALPLDTLDMSNLSDEQIQEGIETGLITPGGKFTELAELGDILTPREQTSQDVLGILPEPTGSGKAPEVKKIPKETAKITGSGESEISKQEYTAMTYKERMAWRQNSFHNKVEYYHPDKGWLGWARPGWTKARWRTE